MSIVNRRNAVLGWGIWKVSKYAAKQKARSAVPTVEDRRPNKPLLAVSLAGLVGALAFWRRFRNSATE